MLLRVLALFVGFFIFGSANADDVPRVIIGIHDSPPSAAADANYLYSLAEMPLNHLGLRLEYNNIRTQVPSLSNRTDVRGILIWLTDGRKLPFKSLTALVQTAVRKKIPVVLMGSFPNSQDDLGRPITLADQNRFLELIGIRSDGGFLPFTFDLKTAIKIPSMVEFERKIPNPTPATEAITPIGTDAKTFLAFDRSGDESQRLHTVILTSQGGYVATGFTHFESKNGAFLQWYLNPFDYFAAAFKTVGMPIPDTTTLSGRRIFYSHIDGDGWGSVSTADQYAGKGIYASEVILKEVAQAHPELPLTVAPIAADIDPLWVGTLKSQQIARAFFRLPNVEPATHTYTHPFEWAFFGPSYQAQNELKFIKKYTKVHLAPGIQATGIAGAGKLNHTYDAPRAYADIPYSLIREVEGSVAYINSFCPPGKRVRLLQWSGDTSPTEDAVAAVIRAGLLNLNGRDTRFDAEAPSYAAVSPIGKRSGSLTQISASHANENVYTDLWQGRFFGFRYLKTSLANTETPLRVKPINIYYHMYSGEKQASLAALREVLNYVSQQDIAPITATQFAAIGQGFFTTKLSAVGPRSWRIENRGALNTLRFDQADKIQVDFKSSNGVLGARTQRSVLYVALDPAVPTPTLTLQDRSNVAPSTPELVDARWSISALKGTSGSATFRATGFGTGTMTWRVPRHSENEQWEARMGHEHPVRAVVDSYGLVTFKLPSGAENGANIRLQRSDLRPALL